VQRNEYLSNFLSRKKLDPNMFENKISFDAAIDEHAAWVFRHIYSKPYVEVNTSESNIDADSKEYSKRYAKEASEEESKKESKKYPKEQSQEELQEKSQEDPSQGIARLYHGMSHICRAAIYAPVWANLYRRYYSYISASTPLNDETIKLLQIAMLFHDAARENDGEDLWDRESAELYYVYLKMLGIDDDLAIPLAEAVANKDSTTTYYDLIINNGEIRWRVREKLFGLKSIYQKIIHDSDCLDIIRARDHFDATYLDFYQEHARPTLSIYSSSELAFEEMAQFIIEARSMIRKHGDTRNAKQFDIKKLFEREWGYLKSLTTIQDSNYKIIPQLYNDGKLVSAEQLKAILLPHLDLQYDANKGLEESNVQAAFNQGNIFARGIIACPSAIHAEDQTLESGEKIERSLVAVEIAKAGRRKGRPTTSSKVNRNDKQGNPARSVCQLSPGSSVIAPSGYLIFNPDNSKVSAISDKDLDTGWKKKTNFISNNQALQQDKVMLKRKELCKTLKMGGSSRQYKNFSGAATHSELIYDIEEYHAVYFSNDPAMANEMYSDSPEAAHPYAPLLQAYYEYVEYKNTYGIELPIYEYSGIHNFIRLLPRENYSDEKIKSMWIEVYSDYVKKYLWTETVDLIQFSLFCRKSLDEIKIEALTKPIALKKDHYLIKRFAALDTNYPSQLKKEINDALEDVISDILMLHKNNNNLHCIHYYAIGRNDLDMMLKFCGEQPATIYYDGLTIAAINGSMQFLDLYIDSADQFHTSCSDIANYENQETKRSLLWFAAQHKQLDAARLFLKHGAKIDHANITGITPLLLAVNNNHIEMVELLLQAGANPNLLTLTYQGNPLNYLKWLGVADEPALKIMQLLIQYGVKVNHRNCLDRAPLHDLLIESKKIPSQAVKILLDNNADINEKGSLSLDVLLAVFAEIDKKEWSAELLLYSQKSKDIQKSFILHDVTPLYLAILFDQGAAVKFLLTNGAEISKTSPCFGLDALATAKLLKRDEIYKLLDAHLTNNKDASNNNYYRMGFFEKEVKNDLSIQSDCLKEYEHSPMKKIRLT
jgi:ankyrin repeat protein